jgi:hypothetical protein
MQGQDRYPCTLGDTYNLLANWKQEVQIISAQIPSTGVSFTNIGDDKVGNQDSSANITEGFSKMTLKTDGQTCSSAKGVTCFRCDQKCHYALECDNERKTVGREEGQSGVQMFMDALEHDKFSDDDRVAFSFHLHGTRKLEVIKATDLEKKIQLEKEGSLIFRSC